MWSRLLLTMHITMDRGVLVSCVVVLGASQCDVSFLDRIESENSLCFWPTFEETGQKLGRFSPHLRWKAETGYLIWYGNAIMKTTSGSSVNRISVF